MIVGDRYGQLTLIAFDHRAQSHRWWRCRCDCGHTVVVRQSNLTTGNTISCGCLRMSRLRRGLSRQHGQAGKERTGEYTAWASMLARCRRPNHPEFKNYGGRGITVCERWLHDFAAFLADMGPRPAGQYPSGRARFTLERINNEQGYAPENCKWATMSEQAKNRRPPHRYT